MCRFAMYLGPTLTLDSLIMRPSNSIVHQSFHSHERSEPLNGDGFGVAWYEIVAHLCGGRPDLVLVPYHALWYRQDERTSAWTCCWACGRKSRTSAPWPRMGRSWLAAGAVLMLVISLSRGWLRTHSGARHVRRPPRCERVC
jgi:hypothetical protein